LDSFVGLEIRETFVAFSHFYFVGLDDITEAPYDHMANALSLGAGIVPKACTKSADALIMLVLSDGNSFSGFPSDLDLWKRSLHKTFVFPSDDDTVPPYAFIYHTISAQKLTIPEDVCKKKRKQKSKEPRTA
jgi:hypothetical protein